MLPALLICITLAAWLIAELYSSVRLVRILAGGIAMVVIGSTTWGVCTVMSQFDKTMQTNTTTKNLTSGLVDITSEPFDLEEFQYRIRDLDKGIEATYEDHTSAKDSITTFLAHYGIEYRSVLQIQVDNPYGAEE